MTEQPLAVYFNVCLTENISLVLLPRCTVFICYYKDRFVSVKISLSLSLPLSLSFLLSGIEKKNGYETERILRSHATPSTFPIFCLRLGQTLPGHLHHSFVFLSTGRFMSVLVHVIETEEL